MRPRGLEGPEIEDLLTRPLPCRLATIDRDGFPRVTPLWFVWDDGCFWMTSLSDRQHLADLRYNGRAGLCVDDEAPNPRGQPHRPNRQVTARGRARLFEEHDGEWTRRITLKYLEGPLGAQHAAVRAAQRRTVICFSPEKVAAFGAP